MNRQRIEQAVAPAESTMMMDTPRRPVPPPTPAPAAGPVTTIDQRPRVPTEEGREMRQVVTAPAAKPVPVYPPKIAKAILNISRSLGVVEKYGFNDFHKYRYPKWEDVACELFPAIIENGLIITQYEIAHGGFAGDLIEITYGFSIINEDGDVWPKDPEITAICKVRDSKGVLDDKAASKCFTQAAKYMYIGLFKIRIQDAAEADSADPKAPPPLRRRPVPSPTGRVAPMMIEAVKGETAKSWSEKIIGYVIKADTLDELDQWEKLNANFLDRLEENDDPTFHNNVIDAFTLRKKQLGGKPAEPANNVAAVQQADEQPSQPARRAPPPPPQTKVTAPNLSDDDLDWLEGLKGAFSGCADLPSLADEVDRLMKPHRANVSEEAWLRAEALQDAAIERINGDE